MQIGVVSLFTDLVDNALGEGVVGRARRRDLLQLFLFNPRDWATDRHRTVDDRPFGGGPGMVMTPGPLIGAIRRAKQVLPAAPVVYLSPQGSRFEQATARRWRALGSLILVAGRYEGIDERVVSAVVNEEVSLGDFVLSGGEFAALAVVDAVTRLEAGVLGDSASAEQDSFGDEGLLDCPHYTRPEEFEQQSVPSVLLSGDHKAIARWRHEQALIRTKLRRPDLLARADLTEEDRIFLTRFGENSDDAEHEHPEQ